MFEPKLIVVPTDLSEPATSALEMARELAIRFHSRISLMYADQFIPSIDLIESPTAYFVEHLPELEQAIERKLSEYAEQHLANTVMWETSIRIGAPAQTILECARTSECDLIVMGTHGRTGWRRMFLGSVAESVLAETTCPVLTVRSTEGHGAVPFGLRKIVCPVNYTDVAARSLDCAVSLAEKFRTELIVVHVVEEGSTYDHSGELETLRSWMPERLREKTELRDLVLHGDPAEEIIELAAIAGADLLVIGAQHKRFSDTTVIGSTTQRITRHAQSPVLTVVREIAPSGSHAGEREALASR